MDWRLNMVLSLQDTYWAGRVDINNKVKHSVNSINHRKHV